MLPNKAGKRARLTDGQTDIGRPFLRFAKDACWYPRRADKALLMASLGCLGSALNHMCATCRERDAISSGVAFEEPRDVALALIDNCLSINNRAANILPATTVRQLSD